MANAGAPLSDLLADAVEAAGRSVVRVEARRRRPASGIVWSADGTIVAAEHAVQDEEHIRVALPDGREVPATLLGRDPSTDIAALRVDAPGLAAAEWRDVGALRVGHLVLALARPGRTVRARIGIVSALGQNWRTPHGGQLAHYLEPDVEPAPGFSGGPLVDVAGQVLGLNTAGLLRGTIVTVTAPTLRRVVDSLRAHGRIRRGYLGVAAHAVRLPLALAGQLQQNTGLLVIAVEPGGPAERAGVLLGDTVVAIDGQPVTRLDDLMGLLGEDRIGASVSVRVLRAGQVQDIPVVVGERGLAA
jgi:S1-C subfamily serine protease